MLVCNGHSTDAEQTNMDQCIYVNVSTQLRDWSTDLCAHIRVAPYNPTVLDRAIGQKRIWSLVER